MVLAIAAVALGDAPPEWIVGVGAGAGAAVVAVVVAAGIALGRASLAGRRDVRAPAYVAGGARRDGRRRPVRRRSCCWRRARRARVAPPARAALHAWPVVLAAAAALPGLAWTAFKVGALSYGGGFVIIPLMQEDAVDRHGWMTDSQFLDAVAFGQLTPGPVTHTVALVGWAAAGLGGALLAAAIAFAPSFLAIALGGERFDAPARQPLGARVPRRRRAGRGRSDPRCGGAARGRRSASGGRPPCWRPPRRCSRSAGRRSGRSPAARCAASRSPSRGPAAVSDGRSRQASTEAGSVRGYLLRWTCRTRRPTSSRG